MTEELSQETTIEEDVNTAIEEAEEHEVEQDETEIITIGEPTEELIEDMLGDNDDDDNQPLIKKIRNDFREKSKRNNEILAALRAEKRELKAQLQSIQAPIQHEGTQSVHTEKPTLEGCDYDIDLFEASLINWNEIERKKHAQQIEQQRQQEQQQAEWNARLNGYNQAKATLKVHDFDEAEEAVISNLSVNQQSIILKYAEEMEMSPEKIVYAVGKDSPRLNELKNIHDPIKFALKLQKIAREIRVTKRSNIKPETRVESSGVVLSGSDAKLEKLLDKAMESGNYTEYVRYKEQLKRDKR
jgi:hypothetical protein